jgi:hypothetical protein
LLQVLRWPNGSVVFMRALSGGGREVRHDDGGVGGHPWSSSAVVERERERERFEREHEEIRNQSVHPSAWELEFWYQQPKCLVWGGW